LITTLMKVIRDFVTQGVTPCSTKITQERMMMRPHNDFNRRMTSIFVIHIFMMHVLEAPPAEEAAKIVRFVF
jgi:hypothetical protein